MRTELGNETFRERWQDFKESLLRHEEGGTREEREREAHGTGGRESRKDAPLHQVDKVAGSE